jgi:hypothetical protein
VAARVAAARLRVHEGHEANVAAAAALLNSSQRVLERHSSEASERSMIGAAAIPFGAPPPAALLHEHAPSEAERRQALLRRVPAQLLPDARLFVADGDDEPAAGALLPWGAFSAFSSRTSPSRTIVALRHFEWAPIGEEGDGERGGGALAHRSGERLPDDMGAWTPVHVRTWLRALAPPPPSPPLGQMPGQRPPRLPPGQAQPPLAGVTSVEMDAIAHPHGGELGKPPRRAAAPRCLSASAAGRSLPHVSPPPCRRPAALLLCSPGLAFVSGAVLQMAWATDLVRLGVPLRLAGAVCERVQQWE